MSRRQDFRLQLTQRAARELHDVFEYSKKQWGQRAADRYFDDLEAGLQRIRTQPDLLRSEPEFHAALKFYRVNKHLFVCDVQPKSIVVLTVVHAGMDIPSRLGEVQPMLAQEVELLHRQFRPQQFD